MGRLFFKRVFLVLLHFQIFKIGHAREASVDIVLVWESETLTGLYFQNKYLFLERRLDVRRGWFRKGGGEGSSFFLNNIFFFYLISNLPLTIKSFVTFYFFPLLRLCFFILFTNTLG